MIRISFVAFVVLLPSAAVFAHEGEPPHQIVDHLAGEWQRDAALSNRLGPESFVIDRFTTLVFRRHPSLRDLEHLFDDGDPIHELQYVGAFRSPASQRVLFALRKDRGNLEFGVSNSRPHQERWRAIHLVRADDPESDLLFIGRTAFRRRASEEDDPQQSSSTLGDDLSALQGKWKRSYDLDGERYEEILAIAGTKQRVVVYRNGKFLQESVSDIEIELHGPAKVLLWRNSVVVRPNADARLPDRQIVFRVVDDKWHCMSGLLDTDWAPIGHLVYKRVSPPLSSLADEDQHDRTN